MQGDDCIKVSKKEEWEKILSSTSHDLGKLIIIIITDQHNEPCWIERAQEVL